MPGTEEVAPTRRRGWIFLSLVVLALLFAGRGFAATAEDEDVRKVVGGFSQSWNAHDMDAFGKLFAADADFVNVAGNWWKGREAIQAQHAYSHGTIPEDTKGFEALRKYHGIFKSSTLRFSEIDVRFLRKDVALAHANWEMLGDTRTPNPRRGLLTFVLTREQSGWLISAAQNTEIGRVVK